MTRIGESRIGKQNACYEKEKIAEILQPFKPFDSEVFALINLRDLHGGEQYGTYKVDPTHNGGNQSQHAASNANDHQDPT
ncbi:hypothetical protein PRBRB14_26100 [Hallella multisaccharivorax DSM 17128]|nr:hypothetical protein PRBRB14_26100 [Hallella multisaccharivorax DSM 17128]